MTIKAQPFDTMQYFYSLLQKPLIRCHIRFDGKIEKDLLCRAIAKLILSYPIMRCRYDVKKRAWVEADFKDDDYFTVFD